MKKLKNALTVSDLYQIALIASSREENTNWLSFPKKISENFSQYLRSFAKIVKKKKYVNLKKSWLRQIQTDFHKQVLVSKII